MWKRFPIAVHIYMYCEWMKNTVEGEESSMINSRDVPRELEVSRPHLHDQRKNDEGWKMTQQINLSTKSGERVETHTTDWENIIFIKMESENKSISWNWIFNRILALRQARAHRKWKFGEKQLNWEIKYLSQILKWKEWRKQLRSAHTSRGKENRNWSFFSCVEPGRKGRVRVSTKIWCFIHEPCQ